MSTERIGKNGLVVGTAAYFEELNKNSMFKWIFTDPRDHHYWDQLSGFADRVISVLEEIHQDLKNNAQVLGYFPSDDRQETIDFVEGLSGICSFMRKSTSTADSCLSLLELRDYSTRPKSQADRREIFEAVAQIQKEGYMWQSDVENMLKKARDYGLRNLSGDEEKLSFIKGLYREESKDFYDDVLLLLEYQNRPDHFKGKCNCTLCSKNYIFNLLLKTGIADISMSDLPKGGTYEYAENIKYALRGIYDTISDDLFANGQYLSVENINKLQLVSDDMTKLISRGFDSLFKSAITDVVNVDGLILDRDYEVLSGDDLALVKALSNEYLWYEQQRNEPVMERLAYEVVKIRQKAEYFDRYNTGVYLNKEGYEENLQYSVSIRGMSYGEIGLEGGENPGMDVLMGIASLLLGSGVGLFLSVAGTGLDMEPDQRVKYVLQEGDIYFSISYGSNEIKKSFYKRDGNFICAVVTEKKKGSEDEEEKVLVNPDIIPKDGSTIMKDNWVPFPANLFLQ